MSVPYEGNWVGTGEIVFQNDLTPDTIDSTGLTIPYNDIRMNIENDTFEITGFDVDFKGTIATNEFVSAADIIQFGSKEQRMARGKNKEATETIDTAMANGCESLSTEIIELKEGKLSLAFYRNRYLSDSRYYKMQFEKAR